MKKRKQGKLVRKMTIFMVFIAIMPLIVSALSIRLFGSFYQQEIQHRQESVVKDVEEGITAKLQSILFSLTPQYNESIDRLVDVVNGKVIISPLVEQRFSLLLENIVDQNPEISFAVLIDGPSGIQVAAHSKTYPKLEEAEKFKNVKNLPYYNRVYEGSAYIGPVQQTINGPQISIITPIRALEDKIPGILMVRIDAGELMKDLVVAHEIEEAGYVFITDDKGRLIAHSRRDVGIAASVTHVDFVGSIIARRNIQTETHQRYKSYWNEEVIGSGKLMAAPLLGIFIELPTREADALVNQLIERFTGITFLVLVLSFLLSVLLARMVVGPIKILEKGAQRVAEGFLDEPVNIKTGDEIEELGEAFNEMMRGLKELQELRDEFVFIAAHELRTPVTAINGYISLVMNNIENITDNVKFLDQIRIANDRLLQLVEDLLEVARSEAGRLTIDVSSVEISESIEDIIKELTPLADEKKIELVYKPKEVPSVLADSKRIKEVMVNIVGNAIKYMGGEGTITITHEIDKKDNALITHIKDTGIGMSKEGLKNLFQKFYRVQTEKTQDITGTGLGLFIVKQIIEKMNGSIWVGSEEGKGSTFSFKLLIANNNKLNEKKNN